MRSKKSLRNLKGLKVLITAGPTREFFDPVRFLSNPSSGKMGYALVDAALKAGAQVTLITGPVTMTPPKKAKVIPVISAEDMYRATLKQASHSDVIIMTAAVSDFRPKNILSNKFKKTGKPLTITLEPTQDILKELGRRKKKGQILIGFAAETNNLIYNAKMKFRKKNLDGIVANRVGASEGGFESEKNKVILISKTSIQSLPLLSKKSTATRIVQFVQDFRTS